MGLRWTQGARSRISKAALQHCTAYQAVGRASTQPRRSLYLLTSHLSSFSSFGGRLVRTHEALIWILANSWMLSSSPLRRNLLLLVSWPPWISTLSSWSCWKSMGNAVLPHTYRRIDGRRALRSFSLGALGVVNDHVIMPRRSRISTLWDLLATVDTSCTDNHL